MKDAVIVESVRTPIGKLGGALSNVLVDFLAAKVIKEIVNRSELDPGLVDEVILGQAKQNADSSNLARLALLRAELPVQIPGYTLHRQCGSGLQAINNADMQIKLGLSDVVIAGGAESMSTAPYYIRQARYGYRSGNGLLLDPNTESQPYSQPIEEYGPLRMGDTAENLAKRYKIDRVEQDEFALRSQEFAQRAINNGLFKSEIVPYEVNNRKDSFLFESDEHPRSTTLEKLSTLKPVFNPNGTVTAGNASGRNDAASAVLMMSESIARERGFTPKARIVAHASSGVSPEIMGIGPVYSTQKALNMSGLCLEDIGLIELNEAFSAQALAVIKELNLNLETVNVNGGAIALGHPIGATGAILTTKLLHEMERRGEKYGLVTLCIAGGQGITTIFENLQV
ncbi:MULTISPECIES: thiolase family protein [Priestia]|uniref:thiolase family protein n=1 Tax=Priestia TaxID=2800373 RepID=UPI0005EC2A7D|nr:MULTISPECIES: thiolase family protein [Priestia]KJL06684.1 acetyl-CoA acetyltransferase [Priestia aryabhattai B8W22]MBX4163435.1 thiolase family protein [Priestia megaterium]